MKRFKVEKRGGEVLEFAPGLEINNFFKAIVGEKHWAHLNVGEQATGEFFANEKSMVECTDTITPVWALTRTE